MTNHHGRSTSPIQAQSSGRSLESSNDDVSEVTSILSTIQLEKISASPPALKLPPLFSLTPNSSGKGGNMQKQQTVPQTNQSETVSEKKSVDQHHSNNHMDNSPQAKKNYSNVQNLKRSVREAALSKQSYNVELSQGSHSDDGSESFFLPLSGAGFSRFGAENKPVTIRGKWLTPQADNSLLENHAPNVRLGNNYGGLPDILNNMDLLNEYDHINDFLSSSASNEVSDTHRSLFDIEEAQGQVFSPPLLMDTSLMTDSY